MAEIKIVDLYKSFDSFLLFNSLSLRIAPLQYVCLLGPSGCGKTTLMRLIAGLERPNAGDIFIGGDRVNNRRPGDREVGLAFQNYALYPHLSVRENLLFPLLAPMRRGQLSSAQMTERLAGTAGRLRIEPLLDKSVNQLSGGQQQRVALGRALIRRPRILLLDEPLTHLDARLRYEMRAELKQLHREMATTTVHVTHDQQEALAIADTIVVMRDGRIEQIGTPLAIYRDPETAFVAAFVGDPPMSLLAISLSERHGVRLIEIGGLPVAPPPHLAEAITVACARDLRVGLRPQNVELVSDGAAGAIMVHVHAHEMIGRRQEIVFRIGEDKLRYRTRVPRRVTIGAPMFVRLSLNGARLFDRRTGIALVRAHDDP